jgi:hypothetical protein
MIARLVVSGGVAEALTVSSSDEPIIIPGGEGASCRGRRGCNLMWSLLSPGTKPVASAIPDTADGAIPQAWTSRTAFGGTSAPYISSYEIFAGCTPDQTGDNADDQCEPDDNEDVPQNEDSPDEEISPTIGGTNCRNR